MDKKYLHHLMTRLRFIGLRYIIAALLVSTIVSVFALRANNIRMSQLRDQVYAADKDGGDVEAALQQLRAYVHTHMNTGLASGDGVYPPIQLKYTYQRLQQAEKDRVAAINAGVYTEAQVYCEQQNPTSFSGGARVACIEQYVTTHSTKEQTVPSALYKFDFVSPSWSPDLAGFSLAVSILLAFVLTVRLIAVAILKRLSD